MKQQWALLGAGVSLLALGVVRGSGGGPALYDGVCQPLPYLVFGGNPPAPAHSKTYSAIAIAGTLEVADSDSRPQAQIIVGFGSLAAPPGASTATVFVTPVTSPAVNPSDGTIDGNVYAFDVQSGGRRLVLAGGHPATVVLEAPASGGSQPTVEHFDGARWTALKPTVTAGCGTTYEAASPTLGVFALVTQGAPPGAISWVGVVAMLIVVVAVASLVIFRALRMGGRRR